MRSYTLWNENWKFIKEDVGFAKAAFQDGGNDYYRGTCWYVKKFSRPELEAGEEAWLEFRGAAMTAEVFLNGQKLARHEGGCSTFRVNLTQALKGDNVLSVSVDNGKNHTVYPQKADFTFYGGIYRDVYLLVVPRDHFALDYHGSGGIRVAPAVSGGLDSAQVTVETWQTGNQSVTVRLGDTVQTVEPESGYAKAEFRLDAPHLWNGVEDPYLYTVTAGLPSGDAVLARFGCRSFEINGEKGFILNGRPLRLCGAARRQDRQGLGTALTKQEHQKDIALLLEMGPIPSGWPITSTTSIFTTCVMKRAWWSGRRSPISPSICRRGGRTPSTS